MTSIDSPGYSEEPVGGGAESVPDPTPPARPDRDPADPGSDALNSPNPSADDDFQGVNITESEGPDIEAPEWSDDSTPQGRPDAARLHEEDQMRSVRALEGDRDDEDN